MVDAVGVPNLVAGVAMLALAGAFLAIAFNDRLHRAFALFLVLRGVMNVVEAVALSRPDAYYGGVLVHFDALVLVATLHLAAAYRDRYAHPASPSVRRLRTGALLAIAVALEATWVLARDGPTGDVLARTVADVRTMAYVIAALVLVSDYASARPGARSSALLLAAAGFILMPALSAVTVLAATVYPPARVGFAVGIVDEPGIDSVVLAILAMSALMLLAIAVTPILLAARARATGDPTMRSHARGYALATVASFAAPLALLGFHVAIGDAVGPLFIVADGVTTLALPVVLAYGILRHRLFDIDVRLRWTVSRGTIAAAFVAVFFVVSEAAASLFSGWTGSTWLGLAAAGLLVFAITPLQQAADRLAALAIPAMSSTSLAPEDRLAFYREQVRVAWADGALSRDERRLLDAARVRLGLSHEEAARIENEIVDVPPAPA